VLFIEGNEIGRWKINAGADLQHPSRPGGTIAGLMATYRRMRRSCFSSSAFKTTST
jgi:hypothetical protein